MKRTATFSKITLIGFFAMAVLLPARVLAENGEGTDESAMSTESGSSASTDSSEAKGNELISSEMDSIPKPTPKKPAKGQRVERADSFVAGTDWEFDGFVAGGQDEGVKSMFYQGDLIYLNIGSQQGLNIGDRVALYKRGNKVKDPQSGRLMGFEVRRAGYAVVTDRLDTTNCSVRMAKSFEAVEIGDLAKRE